MIYRSLASPKDTILVSFWTPELESSGPEDQEPGTGTGARDLTRRWARSRANFQVIHMYHMFLAISFAFVCINIWALVRDNLVKAP